MTFAANMQATALSLLTQYGRAVTLGRVVEGSYDTATSAVSAGTTTSYSGKGHTSPYKASEVDGAVVQGGDVNLLLYATTEPLVGDTATIDARVYRVMTVDKLNAQGVNIAYKLQLRV